MKGFIMVLKYMFFNSSIHTCYFVFNHNRFDSEQYIYFLQKEIPDFEPHFSLPYFFDHIKHTSKSRFKIQLLRYKLLYKFYNQLK
jgi:hypothetical protein